MQSDHHKRIMTKRYKFGRWSIKLPEAWQTDKQGYCVSLRTNGVGLLQITTYRHDNKDITYNNLLGFTEDKLIEGVELQNISCGEFAGIGISYLVDGNYWRKWWLWRDTVLLYVTYNCPAEKRLVEMDVVDQMMNSLKYYPF
jgi:hypothetical protein